MRVVMCQLDAALKSPFDLRIVSPGLEKQSRFRVSLGKGCYQELNMLAWFSAYQIKSFINIFSIDFCGEVNIFQLFDHFPGFHASKTLRAH